mmetsp:Transcript_71556/g.207177  ORF Transcript_71556/g.207177 Transcript_71556/m.207177 type:complete len:213 (+) Transcript_71556:1019-1657(+)
MLSTTFFGGVVVVGRIVFFRAAGVNGDIVMDAGSNTTRLTPRTTFGHGALRADVKMQALFAFKRPSNETWQEHADHLALMLCPSARAVDTPPDLLAVTPVAVRKPLTLHPHPYGAGPAAAQAEHANTAIPVPLVQSGGDGRSERPELHRQATVKGAVARADPRRDAGAVAHANSGRRAEKQRGPHGQVPESGGHHRRKYAPWVAGSTKRNNK